MPAKNNPLRNEFSDLWRLDRQTTFLNHGAFGACPKAILQEQRNFRDRMESGLWDFLIRRLEGLMDQSRNALGQFIGADPQDLVFVPNATAAINTVLRSLWASGDLRSGVEILTTNHTYNSCKEAIDYIAGCSGAKVVTAHVPFPIQSREQIEEAVLSRVTPRTRLAVLDHITSPTTILFATERLIEQLTAAGVETLVDGAHAAGNIDLNVRRYNATYYFGTCHKWLSSPKGTGYLVVRRDRQEMIRPLVISVRASVKRPDRSRYLLEFDWCGAADPSAILCIPAVIKYLGSLLPGGWDELRRRNHDLAVAARRLICQTMKLEPPCPDEMLTSMFTVILPDGPTRPVQVEFLEKHKMEAQFFPWPAAPARTFRGSCQIYNNLAQYERFAELLPKVLTTTCG